MKRRPRLDIDQLLIFFLLAVTIDQAGYWLGGLAPEGRSVLGYLQAAAVDLAIWRSGYWYRRYTGKRQRRWALTGVVAFAAVSTGYNFGYYMSHQLPMWQAALMAAVLPAAVALLSYLYGVKDDSRFGDAKDAPQPVHETPERAHIEPDMRGMRSYPCDRCGQSITGQPQYAVHRRWCAGNGYRKLEENERIVQHE